MGSGGYLGKRCIFNKTKTYQKQHKTHSKIKTKTYQKHYKGIEKHSKHKPKTSEKHIKHITQT